MKIKYIDYFYLTLILDYEFMIIYNILSTVYYIRFKYERISNLYLIIK